MWLFIPSLEDSLSGENAGANAGRLSNLKSALNLGAAGSRPWWSLKGIAGIAEAPWDLQEVEGTNKS